MLSILFLNFWFYPILALTLIVMFSTFESEGGKLLFPIFSLATFVVMTKLLFDVSLVSLLPSTYLGWLVLIVVYFVSGFLWSLFKWKKRIDRCTKDYKEKLENYKRNYNKLKTKEKISSSFQDYLKDNYFDISSLEKKVDVSNYKEKVISWAVYWPLGSLKYILNDFIRDIFSKMFNSLKFYFNFLSKRNLNKFKNLLDDELG